MCDWTTGSHRFQVEQKPFESGKVLKIDRDGVIEWEKRDWHTIKCASSDTSIRVANDGKRVRFMGNIGRFTQSDNLTGVGVVDCVGLWSRWLSQTVADLSMFGAVMNKGTAFEWGTTLSRIDLAGNYDVDDYRAWANVMCQRRIGQRLPLMGKYGPQWGYDSKRGNWWKAKIYDKSAEMAGERGPRSGATVARFEVQLGGEYLKREGLNYLDGWHKGGRDMAQIIYGHFAEQVLREGANVETWAEIPQRLRHLAILWRDGQDCRLLYSGQKSYLKARARLREYGIDLDVPCNVVSLAKHCRDVVVTPLNARRVA